MKKYLYCFLVLFISISDAQVSAGGRMDAAVSYEDAIADRDFDALYDYFERQWRDRPQLGSEAATGIPTIVYERAQRATDREELKVLYDFTNQRFRSDPRSRQYIAPIRREHLGAEFRAINGVNDPQAIEQFIHYYHYVVGSEGGRSGWESELQQVETRMKGLYWGAALSADNEQAIAEFMTRFPDYWPAQRQQYGIRIEAHVEDKDIDGLRLLAEEEVEMEPVE